MAKFTAREYDDLVYRVLDLAAEITALQLQGKVRPDCDIATRLRRFTTSLAGATLARPDARLLVAGKSALKQAQDALAALDAAPATAPDPSAPAGPDFEDKLKGKLAAEGIPQSPTTPPATPPSPRKPSKPRRPLSVPPSGKGNR